MRYYKIMLKKEMIEIWRQKKFFILLSISVLLGIMAPFLTKIMPAVLKSQSTDTITVIVSKVDQYESWSQFFKNFNGLGIIGIIILFFEILSKEIQTGTLINIITKGVSRKAIICSIYSLLIMLYLIFITVSTGICSFYTNYYWGSVKFKDLLFAVSMSGVFGIMLLSFLVLGQALSKKGGGGLFAAGGVYFLSMAMTFVPRLKDYSPYLLINNMQIILGTSPYDDFYKPMIAAALLILISFVVSLKSFDKSCL
mgnify:CR=1 FL=1